MYGGNYLFGAISNSTSVGGILTLSDDLVDMDDGMFEVLLIKSPSNILELNQILFDLTTQNYTSPLISSSWQQAGDHSGSGYAMDTG